MINLNDSHRGGTFCMSKAGLAIGDGSKLGVSIASTVGSGVDYCIDGIMYNLADSATDKPLTADDAQTLLSKCLYLIVVDANGAVTSVKGEDVLTADLTAGTKVLQWPAVPANKCPIGAVKMTLASTGTFTAGTTALDAANVTTLYVNVLGAFDPSVLL